MSDSGTTTTTTTTETPWHTGLDPVLVGNLQTHGWDTLDAPAAAAQLSKSYWELQKLQGVPADQILKLPKDAADADGWKAVWRRLGAPEKPEDYTFEGVDLGDETAAFTDTIRNVATKHNAPKGLVQDVAAEVAKHLKGRQDASTSEAAAANTANLEALRREWGAGYEANRIEAADFAGKVKELMGGGDEIVRAIGAVEKVLNDADMNGHAVILKMFHTLAAGMREDTHKGDGGSRPGPMTYEMALARKQEILMGPESKKWLDGDPALAREVMNLSRIEATWLEARGL